jgi:hypothetical protein
MQPEMAEGAYSIPPVDPEHCLRKVENLQLGSLGCTTAQGMKLAGDLKLAKLHQCCKGDCMC